MARHFQSKTFQNTLRTCLVLSFAGMTSASFAQEKQPASDRFFLTIAGSQSIKTDDEKVDQDKSVVAIAENPAKEPVSLTPLPTPNISLEGIGSAKLPENRLEGRLPPMQPLPFGPDRPYGMNLTLKSWTAPVYCHQPLYFEDAMLERHGHERFPHLTPLISGARFFTGVVTKPYMVYLHPPLEDVPNTGHYRPGSPAPAVRERAPYDKGALRFQLLTTGATLVAIQP